MTIAEIEKQIEHEIASKLNNCGIMYRMFGRAKSMSSVLHKMEIKGEKYRKGLSRIQDIIGLRFIVYFTDDVDIVEMLVNNNSVVDRSIDAPDSFTFCPQRLNLVCTIPEYLQEETRRQLQVEYGEYAQYIDTTFEVQIRTIFSEGWHEVEHDLRYKCKADWIGYEAQSRTLNGVIATLENAEYSMLSLFREMAQSNLMQGNYSAMLRNHLRIRLIGDGLSPEITEYLKANHEIAKAVHETERTVLLLSMLYHNHHLTFDYDTILHLINRMYIQDEGLMQLETTEQKIEFAHYFKRQ